MSVGSFYAHYYASHAQDYANQGIALLNEARSKMQKIAKQVRSSASEKSKQQYANVLNSIFARSSQDKRNFNESRAMDILEKSIIKQGEEYFSIDRNSGAVQKIIDNPDAVFKKNDNIVSYSNKKFMSEQTFEKFIRTIEQIIRDMGTKSSLSTGESQKIIQELQSAINALQNNVRTTSNQVQDPSLKALLQSVEKQNVNIKSWVAVEDAKSQSIIARVNDLISIYYFAYKGAQAQQGDLFEKAGVMAGYLLREVSLTEIEKKLTEVLNEKDLAVSKMGQYGGVSPNLQFTTEFISDKIAKKSFLKKITETKNGNTITSKQSSQQKIDIIIDLDDDNYHRIPTTMSLKSQNLSKSISLVSGTNLWYLIQNESLGFVNGYINIMADHSDSIKKLVKMSRNKANKSGRASGSGEWFAGFKSGITFEDERAAAAKLANQRKYAIAAAEIISFTKAITGATFGRQAAQLMVINDTSTKKIFVIEIADILEYAANSLQQGEKYETLIQLKDGTNFNKVYKNEWGIRKENRIAALLDQLHAQKVSLALHSNIIQKVTKITGE